MADILVGPSKKLYRVHKDKLCKKAPYFADVFSDTTVFPEDLIPTISFPDEKPDTFNIFLTWIYEDHLPTLKPNKVPDKHHGWNWDIFDVYLLAQTLNLPVLQDLVMEALREGQRSHHMLHSLDTVKTVFPRLKDRCAMQRYIGHSLLKAILASDTAKFEALYPTKAIQELLSSDPALLFLILRYLRGMEGRNMKEPRFVEGKMTCGYHDHVDKKSCPTQQDLEAGEKKADGA
ncbi:hypothetical protein N431DRAFT_471424 [Stipitochalara longipes BDJ]|nr:hypothetical protein N431DRAFT_471424 [Stipitochalara longipes BDJ]